MQSRSRCWRAGVLQVSFEDGSAWAFDVPRVHLKGAQEIAGELSRSIVPTDPH
jgi:hypothetical protein